MARGAKCVDAFLGGLQRIIEEDRAVGLDMPDAGRLAPVRGRVETALRRGGEAGLAEAVRLLETVEAQTTSAWTRYVAAMSVSLRVVERALPLRADRVEHRARHRIRMNARAAAVATSRRSCGGTSPSSGCRPRRRPHLRCRA